MNHKEILEKAKRLASNPKDVPKIETLRGVLNLNNLFNTGKIKHIMLDSEDLYTDIGNDVELFLNLKDRVKKTCDKYDVELLELYGVVFA